MTARTIEFAHFLQLVWHRSVVWWLDRGRIWLTGTDFVLILTETVIRGEAMERHSMTPKLKDLIKLAANSWSASGKVTSITCASDQTGIYFFFSLVDIAGTTYFGGIDLTKPIAPFLVETIVAARSVDATITVTTDTSGSISQVGW
jgi:hypothetical protein